MKDSGRILDDIMMDMEDNLGEAQAAYNECETAMKEAALALKTCKAFIDAAWEDYDDLRRRLRNGDEDA